MTLPDSRDLFLLPGIGVVAFAVAWLHLLRSIHRIDDALCALIDLRKGLDEIAREAWQAQDEFNREVGKLLQQLEAAHLAHARRLREQDATDEAVQERVLSLERWMMNGLTAEHLKHYRRAEYTQSRSPLAGAEEEEP